MRASKAPDRACNPPARLDHAKGKLPFRMGIEGPHDAAHVDALLLGLKADGAGHAGFQRHIAIVAGADSGSAGGSWKCRHAGSLPWRRGSGWTGRSAGRAGCPCRRHHHEIRRISAATAQDSPRRAADRPTGNPAARSRSSEDLPAQRRSTASAASASSRDGCGRFGGMDVHGLVLSVRAGFGRRQCQQVYATSGTSDHRKPGHRPRSEGEYRHSAITMK
jgi:hypothetical protein